MGNSLGTTASTYLVHELWQGGLDFRPGKRFASDGTSTAVTTTSDVASITSAANSASALSPKASASGSSSAAPLSFALFQPGVRVVSVVVGVGVLLLLLLMMLL